MANLLVENEEIDIDRLIMDSVNYPENNFVRKYPDLAKEIHTTKNNDIDFSRLTYYSETTKINWICSVKKECGCIHEYYATPRSRTRNGCPFCNGSKICFHESIYYLFPEIMKEWDYTKNTIIDPKNTSRGSKLKVWWTCLQKTVCGCTHKYETEIKSKCTTKTGCPYCISSAGRIFCEHASFAYLFPNLLKEWHPTKNNGLLPTELAPGSHKRIWWQCLNKTPCGCVHVYDTQLLRRTQFGVGCQYCKEGTAFVCEHTSLGGKYPDLAREWHTTKNGDLSPYNVAFGSSKKVWWMCLNVPDCGCQHIYEAAVCSRTSNNPNRKVTGCPYCSLGTTRFCVHNSFEAVFPRIADEWHPTKNDDLKPDMITYGSKKVVWWLGKCGHEYECSMLQRTRGSGCNLCFSGNKCEKIVYDFLVEVYGDIERGFKKDWCKNEETGRYLPFDFYIDQFSLLIEVDGDQHFNDIKSWKSKYKTIQKKDIFKMNCANENNLSMIRIKQEDVYKDLIDWKKILQENIKPYDTVTNIFITRDNLYKDYIANVDNPIIINPPVHKISKEKNTERCRE